MRTLTIVIALILVASSASAGTITSRYKRDSKLKTIGSASNNWMAKNAAKKAEAEKARAKATKATKATNSSGAHKAAQATKLVNAYPNVTTSEIEAYRASLIRVVAKAELSLEKAKLQLARFEKNVILRSMSGE